MFAQVLGP